MEQNSNQNLSSVPRLCKNNCGFFGSDAHDGMCSKCFKDSVKRTQSTQVAASTSLAPSPEKVDSLSTGSTTVASASESSLSTGSPTVSEASLATPEKSTEAASEASAEVSAAPASPASSESGKKRKRCAVCRTKVGLTGFVCRCKGLYCSVHRYSDKHDCTYDYKGAGQEQIRKNNPVVKGQKIQRI